RSRRVGRRTRRQRCQRSGAAAGTSAAGDPRRDRRGRGDPGWSDRSTATGGEMMRHFLEVDDLSAAEVNAVLDLAELVSPPQVLAGKGVALLFEKPSARTRNSTEVAVFQ